MIAVHETLSVHTDAPALLVLAIGLLLISLIAALYAR